MEVITKEQLEYIRNCMEREPHTESISIAQLRADISENSIKVNKEYQRKYILNDAEASKFVESVFLGCPIPEVQLFEEKGDIEKSDGGTIEILDGQQRIMALVNFMNGKYALRGLKKLKFLNGFHYGDLPGELYKKFGHFNLTAKLMKFTSDDDDYKYFVFERLNKGSRKLSFQELRNCIFRGSFISYVKDIAQRKEIIYLTPDIKKGDLRYERTEFVLRTMINCENWGHLRQHSRQTIDTFLKENKNLSLDEIFKLDKRYMQNIKLIKDYIGIEPFIRDHSRITSKIDIETLLINLYHNFNRVDIIKYSDEIKKVIKNILNTNDEYNQLDRHSDCDEMIIGRVNIMGKAIENIIKKGTTEEQPIDEKNKLWESSKNINGEVICPICKNSMHSIDVAEVDHIVPFSKGGKTILENAQLVHSSCNKLKSNNEDYTIYK